MLKSKIKLSNILVAMYTLLVISILFFSACGTRPEDDETKSAEDDFNKRHQGKSINGLFKAAIEETYKGTLDENDISFRCEAATGFIKNDFESLDNNPNSKENPLYILLTAMATVTGTDGIAAKPDKKMGDYIRIFDLLLEKGFTLSKGPKGGPKGLLDELRGWATDNNARIESLYYPLVVLGGISPETSVGYSDGRRETTLPIILWTLLTDPLNRELQRKMVAILTDPAKYSNDAPKVNFTLIKHSIQGKKMTPAMFAADRAQRADNEGQAVCYLENFKLFLRDEKHIKFMDDSELSEGVADTPKLDKQPLLSFIIYNCVKTDIKLQNQWLAILDMVLGLGDKAHGLGDLDLTGKNTKEVKGMKNKIQKYIKDYIIKEGSVDGHFVNNPEYDQNVLKQVQTKLEEYSKK